MQSNKLLLNRLVSFQLNFMLSCWFNSNFDRYLISNNSIRLLNLKFDKLVSDFQYFSILQFEQSFQALQIQLNWSQFTCITSFFIKILFDYLVDQFLAGNADQLWIYQVQRKICKLNLFRVYQGQQYPIWSYHLKSLHFLFMFVLYNPQRFCYVQFNTQIINLKKSVLQFTQSSFLVTLIENSNQVIFHNFIKQDKSCITLLISFDYQKELYLNQESLQMKEQNQIEEGNFHRYPNLNSQPLRKFKKSIIKLNDPNHVSKIQDFVQSQQLQPQHSTIQSLILLSEDNHLGHQKLLPSIQNHDIQLKHYLSGSKIFKEKQFSIEDFSNSYTISTVLSPKKQTHKKQKSKSQIAQNPIKPNKNSLRHHTLMDHKKQNLKTEQVQPQRKLFDSKKIKYFNISQQQNRHNSESKMQLKALQLQLLMKKANEKRQKGIKQIMIRLNLPKLRNCSNNKSFTKLMQNNPIKMRQDFVQSLHKKIKTIDTKKENKVTPRNLTMEISKLQESRIQELRKLERQILMQKQKANDSKYLQSQLGKYEGISYLYSPDKFRSLYR